MLDTKESNTEAPEIELSEIKIEKKYSGCNNCIICLDGFIDKNYLEMPNDNSLCSCKYYIHSDCLEKCNDKCPICLTKMKSNEEPNKELEENTVFRNGILDSPRKRCLCRFGIIIIVVISILTFYWIFFFF